MGRPRSTLRQQHAYRQRGKKRHRARRKNAALNYGMNEARRAKANRDFFRKTEERLRIIEQVFGTGSHVASIVNEQHLLYDLTRWQGPGKRREAELSKQAAAFLRRASRRNP